LKHKETHTKRQRCDRYIHTYTARHTRNKIHTVCLQSVTDRETRRWIASDRQRGDREIHGVGDVQTENREIETATWRQRERDRDSERESL